MATVSSVELLRFARPGVIASGLPSLRDVTALARDISTEMSFDRATRRLAAEAARLVNATESMCVVFDWARHQAWSPTGAILNPQVNQLIADVAGAHRRSVIGNALLEPVGPAPSRVVLALRKVAGGTYSMPELSAISALVSGVAPAIDRLISVR